MVSCNESNVERPLCKKRADFDWRGSIVGLKKGAGNFHPLIAVRPEEEIVSCASHSAYLTRIASREIFLPPLQTPLFLRL
jgi:hypothetical protein